jgi:LacI family transcriptional regulator
LSLRPDITALFVESDIMAMGALRALRELGISVGSEFGVVSSDATEFAEYARPTLTALLQSTSDVAEAAITAVIAADAAGVQRLDVIGFELIRRESCGCAVAS